MSWTLDIIIVLIIGITVFLAWKKGFIKTLLSAGAFIIAIAVTALCADPFAAFLKTTPIGTSIEEATETKISNIMIDESMSIDQLLNGDDSGFNTMTKLAGIDTNELSKWYAENVYDGATGQSVLAKRIAEPIIDTIATVAAVAILYFGTQIILSLCSGLLEKIFNLPVLRTLNKSLGIVIGVILAFIRVLLFCFIMTTLIDLAVFTGSDFLSGLAPEKTLLFRLFSQIDIFSFFF